ncbi:hypothetical protein CW700_04465 [Candidatus Bathyarchaeota archaeon]|nr:MAG: hypothetical protein CW700_04465 [Candidatus Bathyarchaeota archaeon]
MGWALSLVMLLFPGILLTRLLFRGGDVGAIDFSLSALVLGSALTVLPTALLGPYLRGFPSLYARVLLPGIWLATAFLFALAVARRRVEVRWDEIKRGVRAKVLGALRFGGLEGLIFFAVPLFVFLYSALNIFVVDAVGWTACSYYIPLARMIYQSDLIPAYDPYYNLGEPVAKPPLPSLLYSTLFFQTSSTDHRVLALIPLLLGLGSTLCVYAIARIALDRRTSTLSAVVFTATPLFMKCFAFSYLYSADLFALFFFSTALYTYHLSQRKGDHRMAVVSGLSSSLAILSRSYCLYVLLLTLLLIHAILSGERRQQAILVGFIALSVGVSGLLIGGGGLPLLALGVLVMAGVLLINRDAAMDEGAGGKRLRSLLIVLALASLSLPWYLRNFLLFGDPVYPNLGPIFHTSPLSDDFVGDLFHEISKVYWRPAGESSHVGSLLNTALVPLLSFDFGIFLFLFKVSGLLSLIRGRSPLNTLLSPWAAVSYVTWLLLFNYSTNYLIQVLPLLSILCAVGMMKIYGRLEDFVGHLLGEDREPRVFVLTTVFSLFGYYLLYYLDLWGLLPQALSSLYVRALYLSLPLLEGLALSLLPLLILPPALLSSIVKGIWGHHLHLGIDERKRTLASAALLGGLLITFSLYIAPRGIVGVFKEAAIGGVFSWEEAQGLGAFIEREVPPGEVVVSLTPEPMRLLMDHEVLYLFTPGGLYGLKDLLLTQDEETIVKTLRERGITYFIVPEPTQGGDTGITTYKALKQEMIYKAYLFLTQRFKIFNLLQREGGPFREVFSNGSYAVYHLS